MELTEQQNKLFDFVKEKHGEQKRKYTNEPYCNHLYSVAKIVSEYEPDCIEIALCHDLFEDTNCNFDSLYKKLIELEYDAHVAYCICGRVKELTDKFTSEEYPYLNRAKRKESECKRLFGISFVAQSVKYADLIDNTATICQYDKDFAKIYLKEKEQILAVMTNGNKVLLQRCKNVLNEAIKMLNNPVKL